uniref:Uncharacterized protein n=1 Tax=Lepeophtheirus salmonis TaxID=72036 RepID=A0A0K2U4N3_LEPSM
MTQDCIKKLFVNNEETDVLKRGTRITYTFKKPGGVIAKFSSIMQVSVLQIYSARMCSKNEESGCYKWTIIKKEKKWILSR